MSNLPDTFAGGVFNLPIKIAKVVRQASGSDGERQSANTYLEKFNYFLDRAGVLWDLDKVPDFAKDELTKKENKMSKSRLEKFPLYYERTGTEFELTKKVDSLLERIVNKVRGLIWIYKN